MPKNSPFRGQILRAAKMGLAATAVALLAACSSPVDKANRFYEKGAEFLKSGDLVKANIEFQNAIQIKDDLVPAWYGLAQVAERQANWERMHAMLRKVLDRDPKHAEAQLKLGRLLLVAGQVDKALAASDTSMKLSNDSPASLSFHAAVLYKLEDVEGALKFANAALAKDPNSVDALIVLATERIDAKDATKAIEYLDRGLAQNEKNIALQLIKVKAFAAVAKLDSAEEVYRKLIAHYPDVRVLRQSLAQFLLANGKREAAEAEFRAILDANPTDTTAKLEFVRFVSGARGPKGALAELESMISKEPGNDELKFAAAELQLFLGNRKAADEIYLGIIAKGGDNPSAIRARGNLAAGLYTDGKKAEARKLVDEILAKDQRNEQGLIVKASLAIDERQLDQAVSDLRQVLKDTPNSARALQLLGRAHEMQGSIELAQEQYLKAAMADRTNPRFTMPYAEFLLKRGQHARAASVAEGILKSNPNYPPAMKLLAQARLNKGDLVGAQAVADELRRRNETTPMADEITGAVQAAQNKYPQSIAAFKRAYEASSTDDPRPMLTVVRGYLAAGKENEAIVFLNSVIRASPKNYEARMALAQIYTGKGDDAGAKQNYQGAIDTNPKDPRGYVGLASHHMFYARYADSQKVVEEGLAAVPGDFNLRLMKAGVLELSGRYDDAIALNEQLLKEKPNSDVVANNLASLLSDHRTDKATLARANEIARRFKRSEVPQFKDTLGWTSYRVGKPDEALPLLEAAAKQMPEQPAFRYHLGMTYLAINRKDAARKELEKAVSLGEGREIPESVKAKEALKGI